MMYNFRENNVRVEMVNNEPWFVAKDVCEILDIKNSRDAVSRIEEEDKASVGINDGVQVRHMSVINESGLYNLIFTSTRPDAKEFKRWVTREVLPSIRKTGSYSQQPMTQMEMIAHMSQSIVDNERKRLVYESKVDTLIETMRIDGVQAHAINKQGKAKVLGVLGGCDSPAYKELKGKLFARLWRDFKNHFSLPRYDELPKSKYDEAVKFISMWQPDTSMLIKIEFVNGCTYRFKDGIEDK